MAEIRTEKVVELMHAVCGNMAHTMEESLDAARSSRKRRLPRRLCVRTSAAVMKKRPMPDAIEVPDGYVAVHEIPQAENVVMLTALELTIIGQKIGHLMHSGMLSAGMCDAFVRMIGQAQYGGDAESEIRMKVAAAVARGLVLFDHELKATMEALGQKFPDLIEKMNAEEAAGT